MMIKQQSSIDIVKTIGYVLVIVLIFSPLTFLISNTITGSIENTCYREFINVNISKNVNNSKETICQDTYMRNMKIIQRHQFLIVSIISILTIILLLFLGTKIDSIISYSLFFASALNTIIIVMKNSSSSILAAGLGIILFILVLLFINKNLKK